MNVGEHKKCKTAESNNWGRNIAEYRLLQRQRQCFNQLNNLKIMCNLTKNISENTGPHKFSWSETDVQIPDLDSNGTHSEIHEFWFNFTTGRIKNNK